MLKHHHVMRHCLAFAALVLAASLAQASRADRPETDLSADGVPQRLVLALDGIPYDVFVDLQQRGHFAGFRPAARMVSTFPSLSDVSFAAIGGSQPPDGYQVMRFDPLKNKVVGNTLASLSDRAHPNLPADSSGHTSLHRMIGYVAAYSIAVHDMHAIGREVLRSPKATFVAYLEQSDAVLHVSGRPGAEKFLLALDAYLQRLQAQVRARTGRELMVDIVSDHGSTLAKGRAVPIEKLLRGCGYQRSNRLERRDEVAYSLSGIIGSVAITTADDHVEEVARCIAAAEGVDLVAIDRGEAVGIVSSGGEAEVRLADELLEAYDYRTLRGDPLGLLQDQAAPAERRFEESQLFAQTADAARPDPLRRLWRAFHGAVKVPSPILVSLADGHEAGNGVVRTLAKVRGRAGTHGSMTRLASLGVFASNWRDVQDVDAWRANSALFGPDTVLAARRVASERIAHDSLLPSPSPARGVQRR